MISHYIKGYKKKYSIREDGNVIRHYRLLKGKKILYQNKLLTKYLPYSSSKSCLVTLLKNSKGKATNVNKLMEKYFKLTPLDNFHSYIFDYKDGNVYNNSIKNLVYKIKCLRRYKYEPKCTHKNKKIISKICGNCGKDLPISFYGFSSSVSWRGSHTRMCYRNMCESCRSIKQWDSIKADPKKLAKSKEANSTWAKSEKGIKYIRAADKKYRKELRPGYINYLIKQRGMDPNTFTEEMKDIFKINIKINRKIKIL